MFSVKILLLILYLVKSTFSINSLRANSSNSPNIKIIGGADATVNQFPYMVSIQHKDGDQYCGGSIITLRHILTAGHCLNGKKPGDIEVRVGSITSDEGGTVVAVKKIILHPEFNVDKNKVLINDIGIIVLEKDLRVSKSVGLMSAALKEPADGTKCTISGFGYTVENQEDDPNKKLKFVGMDIYNREKCGEQIFLSQKPNLIICAGGVAGKGTCSQDSGSPLVCPTSNAARPTMWQAGIVNYGLCGVKDTPTVFASVAKYTNWIAKQLLVLS